MRNIRAGLGETLKIFGVVFGIIGGLCALLTLPFVLGDLLGDWASGACIVVYLVAIVLWLSYEVGREKFSA